MDEESGHNQDTQHTAFFHTMAKMIVERDMELMRLRLLLPTELQTASAETHADPRVAGFIARWEQDLRGLYAMTAEDQEVFYLESQYRLPSRPEAEDR